MNRRQFVGASGALGLVLATGATRRSADAQTIYASVDLGLPEGFDSVVPIALNENGVAVVAATKGETQAIFTVADGVFTRMGREGSMAHAACIDLDGNVGGWIEISGASTPVAASTPAAAGSPTASDSRDVPVILTEGNQSEMPGGPVDGRVLGLQQGGTAVGEAAIEGSKSARKAVIWAHQEVQELPGTPSGGTSAARDINALGQIAGWIERGEGAAANRTAVLFDPDGDPVEIGGSNSRSEAVAISEQGQVAGNSIAAGADGELGGDGTAAFFWADGAVTPLLELEGQRWSMAADLNSYGLVAGTVGLGVPGPTGAETTAVVWGANTVFDLNQHAQPVDGVTFTTAVAINELGQVLCGGIDANGNSHAVLLSTVGN